MIFHPPLYINTNFSLLAIPSTRYSVLATLYPLLTTCSLLLAPCSMGHGWNDSESPDSPLLPPVQVPSWTTMSVVWAAV